MKNVHFWLFLAGFWRCKSGNLNFFENKFLFRNLEPIIHKVTWSQEKSNEFYKMTPRIAHSYYQRYNYLCICTQNFRQILQLFIFYMNFIVQWPWHIVRLTGLNCKTMSRTIQLVGLNQFKQKWTLSTLKNCEIWRSNLV